MIEFETFVNYENNVWRRQIKRRKVFDFLTNLFLHKELIFEKDRKIDNESFFNLLYSALNNSYFWASGLYHFSIFTSNSLNKPLWGKIWIIRFDSDKKIS